MKKTIVTLLALGSVSMGALSESQLANPTDITLQNGPSVIDATTILTGESFNQAFTAVLTLDVEALSVFTTGKPTSGASKIPLLSWKVDDAGTENVDHTVNISVNNNSNANGITTGGFYFKSADDASAFTSTGATVFGSNGNAATSALTSIDWTNAAGAALTVTYNGISSRTAPLGVQIYFSVAMNDGSIVTLNAGNNGTQWVANQYDVTEIRYTTTYLDALTIYDGYATADQAWELNKGVLPSIPEPATATLSLLALAGLAARRRRK